jgi:Hint domain
MLEETKRARPANRARRHFLGLAAATSAKAAALGALAVTALASPASAKNDKDKGGKGGGRGHGDGHCFLRGTSILTPTGEVRIEHLKVGDLVETVRGQPLPIKWIGMHLFRKSRAHWHERVMPVRVSRHAIDARTPHADLYLSPDHALFLDGVLMPVKELVNGISIVPALPADTDVIEYFHILLDTHEAVLAEGAPAETCLLGHRGHEDFTNFIEYERLYGGEAPSVMVPFAPLVGYESGREHLKALLRLGASPFITVPDPVQSAYERLAARARQLVPG